MKTRLKELRKRAGYGSAEAFAEKVGISVHTYRKYEQGTIDLYLDTACDLAEALGCTLEELMGRAAHERKVDEYDDTERAIIDAYRNGDFLDRALIERAAGVNGHAR